MTSPAFELDGPPSPQADAGVRGDESCNHTLQLNHPTPLKLAAVLFASRFLPRIASLLMQRSGRADCSSLQVVEINALRARIWMLVLLRPEGRVAFHRPPFAPASNVALDRLARPLVTPDVQALYIAPSSPRLHTRSGLVVQTRERTIVVADRHFRRLPSSIRSPSEPDPPAPVPCL